MRNYIAGSGRTKYKQVIEFLTSVIFILPKFPIAQEVINSFDAGITALEYALKVVNSEEAEANQLLLDELVGQQVKINLKTSST